VEAPAASDARRRRKRTRPSSS